MADQESPIRDDMPALRRRPTEAELKLWPYLRRRIPGCRFRRDEAIGPYRVDFVCADPRIVVEIDAGQNESAVDADREQWLLAEGYRLLRYSTDEVMRDLAAVVQSIIAAVADIAPAAAEMQNAVTAEDEFWMRHALGLAQRAAEAGEVPVGAVLIDDDGQIVAEGWNLPISLHDASAHAEMLALRGAGLKLANYRLTGTTLYVTLEPCVMCAGAIIHARVSRLVYAARDPKAGAVDSVYDVIAKPRLNHPVEWVGGVLEAEASELLRSFFRARR